MKRQLFSLYEAEPIKATGMHAVSEREAMELNKKGFGIFWEVNIHSPRGKRGKKYVSKLMSCFCDLDELSKADQWEMLSKHLAPSLIVETQRGYHAYWDLKDQCPQSVYEELQERIVFFFGADENAKDSARVLRAPGFYHMKDISAPFLIQVKYRSNTKYTVDELKHCFPSVPKEEEKRNEVPEAFKKAFGDDLFDRINSIGNQYALERLSGSPAVNGEWFGFKYTGDGKHNILVNGKSTSCWIDKNDRIGSPSGGGPTFTQWVNWYHQDWRVTFNYLKTYLPELFK